MPPARVLWWQAVSWPVSLGLSGSSFGPQGVVLPLTQPSVERDKRLEPLSLTIHPQFLDLRVAVLGNVDSGKSTLLGVLTQGELDNGRGRARLNLFRHLHEIQSGRTSSISFEILGFNSKGEVHALNGTQWGQTVRMGWQW